MIEISGFKCRIIRSDRKNMRISVNSNGGICVSVPKKATAKQISDFVKQHSDFIKNAVIKQTSIHNTGIFGDEPNSPFLYYKGEKYPVIFTSTALATFDGKCFILPEGLTVDEQRSAISELYRPLAKEYISARAEELSRQVGLRYKRLRFAKNTSRWGSRSSSGTISFSIYLIATSPKCIDHVIYHELAHIKEMNHSMKFYKILDGWEPSHRERQKELSSVYGKWIRKFKPTSS